MTAEECWDKATDAEFDENGMLIDDAPEKVIQAYGDQRFREGVEAVRQEMLNTESLDSDCWIAITKCTDRLLAEKG